MAKSSRQRRMGDLRLIELLGRVEAVGWALAAASSPFVVLLALVGLLPLLAIPPAVAICAWQRQRLSGKRAATPLPAALICRLLGLNPAPATTVTESDPAETTA